ncbi:hypothetical protein O0I10_010958 [Lichtheimia ornata]|uniref:SWIM-type domain-containing protein n=1 Tax=Lichtheimia ornata TaxID=688661 RepID=A0AAD7UTY4_9FUNG|nr:uncharacterized protein O0I10_010958 [Lichtheimia ornata]KAJ8653412.1 hypothetical protein O0I10_010958 [Lichtheimia ornata]
MVVTPFQSITALLSRLSLQGSNASNNTQQQQRNERQSTAAIDTMPVTQCGSITTRLSRLSLQETKAKRHMKRPSPTDPGTKGRVNKPKRSKLKPSVQAKALQRRLDRAFTQRMYVVSRVQKNDHHIEFHVLGSTGNHYTVHITNKMRCDCYDYQYKRLHCKHLLLVLARVLHVEKGSPAYAKLSLTDDELEQVFANCVPDPDVMV